MSKIGERRRQEILQAATAEFSVKGISGASVSEIASRAGIGKSTIYEYFPSKSKLFAEVCIHKMLEIRKKIQKVFEGEEPFHSQLRAYCCVLLDSLEGLDLGSVLMLLMNDPSIGELAKSARSLRDYAIQQLAQALRRAQATGEISPQIDPLASACFLAILPNPHLICNLREHGVDQPLERLVEFAFDGLASR